MVRTLRLITGAFLVLLLPLVLVGCADAKAVNAAFVRNRISWFVFDPGESSGLRVLPGFEQPMKITWVPRPQAVRATELAVPTGAAGAVAVSHLGLILLNDGDGTLTADRPGAQYDLALYGTGVLFTWKGRLFMTLNQELPLVGPPETLAWWLPGQRRMAFLPVPSQIRNPLRQAVSVRPPVSGTSLVKITWKIPDGTGWQFDGSLLSLDGGDEVPLALVEPSPQPTKAEGPELASLRQRLADRLGSGMPAQEAVGLGAPLLFTESGWVAVTKAGEDRPRLYRLPDLGVAGRYTAAAALTQGYVFTWETAYRGYVGAAGLVHVPFSILAP